MRWFLTKPFQLHELAELCTDMLTVRVDMLLAEEPSVALPRRADGRWVEIEALEATLTLAALACDRAADTVRSAQVLHAPSPRAAVECLTGTVREWFSMLFVPPAPESESSLAKWRAVALTPLTGRPNEEVRLGDEQLRRVAARTPEPLRTRMYLALCCARHGWRWRVDRGVELVVDPPVEEHRVRGQYHSETGPALRYRDGWEVYALHGIRVPAHVITNPEKITVDEIRGERNAELRRVLRERFGEERYLAETGAVLIDADTVPIDALVPGGRSITRALIEDEDHRRFLVSSDGSTRRVYHMEVPPACETCKEAYVALSGRPDVRTIVEA